ncbi:hypothetical protein FZI91_20630 [Mycobacterium sp. CBMA271]|uniref:hypothetical protein n=1 Tax=unclassified Mycobacteroides TaxID=2618759 RepID=UPI0012DF3C0F|nr:MULTISPECIES: hypothetical protein [unclassified Mycobacteroides]MUM24094.1 hypothetical protein [Mycobacteroides sp. CBMA 271]
MDTAQQHNNSVGDDIDNMRTTLQNVFVQGGKIQTTNNISITVNRDVEVLKSDASGIGDAGLASAVNALGGAVDNMRQSVDGLFGTSYATEGNPIPSPDTYGFVDAAGDKQQAVAAVLNQLRTGGCS